MSLLEVPGSEFFSKGFADYGDGSRETEEQIGSYAGAQPSHCKT
jgi:hypothetical protein